MMGKCTAAAAAALCAGLAHADGVTEFCLDGELDLGVRYQGMRPAAGEFYPTTWCVITEDDSGRISFTGAGRANPDMDGGWTVAYVPPDFVRIVNRESPPDIEFRGADSADEARRVRRVDPRRLLDEWRAAGERLEGLAVVVSGDEVHSIDMSTDLPLRGQVAVRWQWDWAVPDRPSLEVFVDDELLYRANGRWRDLPDDEAESVWQVTEGEDPIQVPGEIWPANVNMELINLTDDVYLVRGVRSGFQHLVVDTDEGLVVGDAPAGWVEFHHLPPSDLVPGLGVSGLSERFIDFLRQEFPERAIRAVVLTHFHDDHAGGARAFAAEGAEIFVPAESARFLRNALNRGEMPDDRLHSLGERVRVTPVSGWATLGDRSNRVRIVSMGESPHTSAMLGVWAVDRDYFFVSDVHVPDSDAPAPREGRHRPG